MKKSLFIAFAAFAGSAMAADLPPICQEYFKQIEAAQLPAEVKSQLEVSKQHLSTMPLAAQEQACKQGVEMLKQMVPAK